MLNICQLPSQRGQGVGRELKLLPLFSEGEAKFLAWQLHPGLACLTFQSRNRGFQQRLE